MKVVCIGEYRNKDLVYHIGDEFEIPKEEYDFLMRDAPGCFKQVGRPRKDKMVRSPVVKKHETE